MLFTKILKAVDELYSLDQPGYFILCKPMTKLEISVRPVGIEEYGHTEEPYKIHDSYRSRDYQCSVNRINHSSNYYNNW